MKIVSQKEFEILNDLIQKENSDKEELENMIMRNLSKQGIKVTEDVMNAIMAAVYSANYTSANSCIRRAKINMIFRKFGEELLKKVNI